MVKIRKRGTLEEYHLYVKQGDTVLYDGWYTRYKLTKLKHCIVSPYCIKNRIDRGFPSLWAIITERSMRHPKAKKKDVLEQEGVDRWKQIRPKDRPLTRSEEEHLWMMSLMKPGSEAHKVL